MTTTTGPYIHPTAIVEAGAVLEDGVSVWHFCHVRSGAKLGRGVSLGKDVYVDIDVEIGEFSRIQNGVSVYRGVHIEPWCFIGPQVVFTNDLTPRAGTKNWEVLETRLAVGASLGAGTVVRCGVNIGAFALVGAGGIVTTSIPPFTLAIGVPARSVNRVCACGRTQLPLETPIAHCVLPCCKEVLTEPCLAVAEQSAGALKT